MLPEIELMVSMRTDGGALVPNGSVGRRDDGRNDDCDP